MSYFCFSIPQSILIFLEFSVTSPGYDPFSGIIEDQAAKLWDFVKENDKNQITNKFPGFTRAKAELGKLQNSKNKESPYSCSDMDFPAKRFLGLSLKVGG